MNGAKGFSGWILGVLLAGAPTAAQVEVIPASDLPVGARVAVAIEDRDRGVWLEIAQR